MQWPTIGLNNNLMQLHSVNFLECTEQLCMQHFCLMSRLYVHLCLLTHL